MTATLDPAEGHAVQINAFSARPGQAEELAAVVKRIRDETIRQAPGFISASIHVSDDGARAIVYAQWRSRADDLAMRGTLGSQQRLQELQSLSTSFDPVACSLRYGIEAGRGSP